MSTKQEPSSLRRVITIGVALSHLLAACESGQVERTASASSAPAAVSAPDVSAGWPEGTPGLRDVTVSIVMADPDEKAAEIGSQGFFIIEQQETGKLAKLVFVKGKTAVYRLPSGTFTFKLLGPDALCKTGGFVVPEAPDPHTSFRFEMDHNYDVTKLEIYSGPNLETLEYKSRSWCRPERPERPELQSAATSEAGLSTGEKIALYTVATIVLVPLMVLGGGWHGSIDFGG